jgi:hypothetical protein
VNELLEGSLRYLDACGNTKDSVLSMKETIRELQSALRWRKVGDSSVESVVSAYICSRRKMIFFFLKNSTYMKTGYQVNNQVKIIG